MADLLAIASSLIGVAFVLVNLQRAVYLRLLILTVKLIRVTESDALVAGA